MHYSILLTFTQMDWNTENTHISMQNTHANNTHHVLFEHTLLVLDIIWSEFLGKIANHLWICSRRDFANWFLSFAPYIPCWLATSIKGSQRWESQRSHTLIQNSPLECSIYVCILIYIYIYVNVYMFPKLSAGLWYMFYTRDCSLSRF